MTLSINIIDPALSRLRGHNFEWNKKLYDYYTGAGFRVSVYCNRRASQDVLARFDSIKPIFLEDPHRQEQPGAPDASNKQLAEELSRLMVGARLFESELTQVEHADIQLFPTLFGYQAAGTAASQLSGSVRGLVHHEPSRFSPLLGMATWHYIQTTLKVRRRQIKLFVTTPELQSLYQSQLNLKCHLLPSIYDAVEPAAPSRHPQLTIGLFGQQRVAKGLQLVPEIVDRLSAQGHHVILQNSAKFVNFTSNSANVESMGYIEDLNQAMQRCDIVVAPYDGSLYRYNMAGIVIQALCCGVPVVAPGNSSSGNLVKASGAGEIFTSFNGESVIAAIERLISRHVDAKQKALETRETYAANNGVAKFATGFIS